MEPILDTLISRDDSLRVRFFPVRHYSPTSARTLREVIDDLDPTAVLIEGPSDYNERIDELYLQHELPVALFSYVRYSDNSRASAFYPFCEFSPEWQAISGAKERGIPTRFIDKPWYEIAHRAKRKHRYADRQFTENDYIAQLCHTFEVQNFDEVWDVLFELEPEIDPETYLTRAYHFVYQLRYMSGEPSYEDEQREEFMAARIREALEEFPDGMILVVTGGFHTPALNARLRDLPLEDLHYPLPEDAEIVDEEQAADATGEVVETDADAPDLDEIPDELLEMLQQGQVERVITEHGITLTPFTYERIDKMSGYQSGVHGPAFYRYVWEARARGELLDGRDLLYDIVQKLRNKGQILSTSDAIAVETTAWALASMRGRKELWRYDLLDALSAAVIKEEQDAEYEHPVLTTAREVFRGDRRGLLGEGTDLPPLVKNTRRDLHRANLTPDQDKKHVELELLDAEDREKSILLHRCKGLGVAGFKLTEQPDLVGREDLSNPTERWEVLWSPEYEASLIENAVYGADLAEAATSKLLETAREVERDAEKAALIVLDATMMGLHESTEELYERLLELVREDQDFFHLTAALDHLLYLFAFDEVFGGKDADHIGEILGLSYNRALWLFESLGQMQGREKDIIEAIAALFHTFQRCEDRDFTDRQELIDLLERVGMNDDQMPLMRGATLGALFTMGEADMDLVLETMNYFSDPMDLGDFLIGFFSLAREAAQRDARLLEQLDEMVMSLHEDHFWEVLPGLRLAFTFFTPREKHNLIDMLFPHAPTETGEGVDGGLPPVDPTTWEHAKLLADRVLETIACFGLRAPRERPQLEGDAADQFDQPPAPPQAGERPDHGEHGDDLGQPSSDLDGEGEDAQGDGDAAASSDTQEATGAHEEHHHGSESMDAPPTHADRSATDVTHGVSADSDSDTAAGERGALQGDGASSVAAGSGGAAAGGQHTPRASGSGGFTGGGDAAGEDFEAAPTDAAAAGEIGEVDPQQFSHEERMARWKMVLGVGGEDLDANLPESWQQREQLISYLYDREYGHGRNVRGSGGGMPSSGTQRGKKGGTRQGGQGASQMTVPDWINGVHDLFPQRVIERLEKDALDRYEIEELVTRPELLEKAEPNTTLMKAVLRTKHLMDAEVLTLARKLVRKVVRDLMEKLAREVRTPFTGSADRRRRSFLKIAKNFDADETIRRNLKHYDPDSQSIVIQDPFFFSRVRRQVDRWQLIIVVDESGSMMDSVIHSAVSASIFWGVKALKTHLVIFDTEVVDLTSECSDPVETLMKVQLGGGTDIAKAVRYAQTLINNPRRTILLLVTDFYEGGDANDLLAATREICEGGTTFLGLAALDDQANPTYDRDLAQRMVNLGAHVGAMTPGELAAWVADKVR